MIISLFFSVLIASPYISPFQKQPDTEVIQQQIIHLKKNYDDYILRIKKLQNTISNLAGELKCLQPRKPPKRQVLGESRYESARSKCQFVKEKIEASDYLVKTYYNILEQYGYDVQDYNSYETPEYESITSSQEFELNDNLQTSTRQTSLPILQSSQQDRSIYPTKNRPVTFQNKGMRQTVRRNIGYSGRRAFTAAPESSPTIPITSNITPKFFSRPPTHYNGTINNNNSTIFVNSNSFLPKIKIDHINTESENNMLTEATKRLENAQNIREIIYRFFGTLDPQKIKTQIPRITTQNQIMREEEESLKLQIDKLNNSLLKHQKKVEEIELDVRGMNRILTEGSDIIKSKKAQITNGEKSIKEYQMQNKAMSKGIKRMATLFEIELKPPQKDEAVNEDVVICSYILKRISSLFKKHPSLAHLHKNYKLKHKGSFHVVDSTSSSSRRLLSFKEYQQTPSSMNMNMNISMNLSFGANPDFMLPNDLIEEIPEENPNSTENNSNSNNDKSKADLKIITNDKISASNSITGINNNNNNNNSLNNKISSNNSGNIPLNSQSASNINLNLSLPLIGGLGLTGISSTNDMTGGNPLGTLSNMTNSFNNISSLSSLSGLSSLGNLSNIGYSAAPSGMVIPTLPLERHGLGSSTNLINPQNRISRRVLTAKYSLRDSEPINDIDQELNFFGVSIGHVFVERFATQFVEFKDTCCPLEREEPHLRFDAQLEVNLDSYSAKKVLNGLFDLYKKYKAYLHLLVFDNIEIYQIDSSFLEFIAKRNQYIDAFSRVYDSDVLMKELLAMLIVDEGSAIWLLRDLVIRTEAVQLISPLLQKISHLYQRKQSQLPIYTSATIVDPKSDLIDLKYEQVTYLVPFAALFATFMNLRPSNALHQSLTSLITDKLSKCVPKLLEGKNSSENRAGIVALLELGCHLPTIFHWHIAFANKATSFLHNFLRSSVNFPTCVKTATDFFIACHHYVDESVLMWHTYVFFDLIIRELVRIPLREVNLNSYLSVMTVIVANRQKFTMEQLGRFNFLTFLIDAIHLEELIEGGNDNNGGNALMAPQDDLPSEKTPYKSYIPEAPKHLELKEKDSDVIGSQKVDEEEDKQNNDEEEEDENDDDYGYGGTDSDSDSFMDFSNPVKEIKTSSTKFELPKINISHPRADPNFNFESLKLNLDKKDEEGDDDQDLKTAYIETSGSSDDDDDEEDKFNESNLKAKDKMKLNLNLKQKKNDIPIIGGIQNKTVSYLDLPKFSTEEGDGLPSLNLENPKLQLHFQPIAEITSIKPKELRISVTDYQNMRRKYPIYLTKDIHVHFIQLMFATLIDHSLHRLDVFFCDPFPQVNRKPNVLYTLMKHMECLSNESIFSVLENLFTPPKDIYDDANANEEEEDENENYIDMNQNRNNSRINIKHCATIDQSSLPSKINDYLDSKRTDKFKPIKASTVHLESVAEEGTGNNNNNYYNFFDNDDDYSYEEEEDEIDEEEDGMGRKLFKKFNSVDSMPANLFQPFKSVPNFIPSANDEDIIENAIQHSSRNQDDSWRIFREEQKAQFQDYQRLLRMLAPGLFHPEGYSGGQHIASGAFGAVMAVNYEGQLLAVKVLEKSRNEFDNPHLVEVFTEVSILEVCKGDRRVTQLFDYGCTADSYYIVMEFYPMTMKGWRKKFSQRNEKPPDDVLLRLYREFLNSCTVLVDHRINHFDIKCDNVMLDKDGYPALADFGEAMSYKNEMNNITLLNKGTEWIKSPEMLSIALNSSATNPNYDRRKRVGAGPESDIWSIGCLFFELITGEFLFLDSDWSRFFLRITDPTKQLLTEESLALLDHNKQYSTFLEFVLQRSVLHRPDLKQVIVKFDEMFPHALDGPLPKLEMPKFNNI